MGTAPRDGKWSQQGRSHLWDAISPKTLFRASLPSTLGLTDAVTVVPRGPRSWTISWEAQATAVKYLVFASPSPVTRNKFKTVHKSETTVDFIVPIVVPDDYVFYFWVAYENPQGTLTYLSSQPVYTAINDAFEDNPLSEGTERDVISGADMKFYVESIRRRHLAMIENDGEDVLLYIRRMHGQPVVDLSQKSGASPGDRVQPMYGNTYSQLNQDFDPQAVSSEEQAESDDPEYQAPYRNPDAFGTGIAGGYLPAIKIRIRYGNIPRRELRRNEQGIEVIHNFDSWTIWHPA
jgi:hypothetical protein